MVITKVRVSDDYNEHAEILVQRFHDNGRVTLKVKLDFNPDDEPYPSAYMVYTPEQVRQLAARLMEAAYRAAKGIL